MEVKRKQTEKCEERKLYFIAFLLLHFAFFI